MSLAQLIFNEILPGDAAMAMPPGSAIDFDHYIEREGCGQVVEEFCDVLRQVCDEKFADDFFDLDPESRLAALNRCKTRHYRHFISFITESFRCYYSDPQVLTRLSTGSVPPFPAGNTIEDSEWDSLAEVYQRGKIYREPL